MVKSRVISLLGCAFLETLTHDHLSNRQDSACLFVPDLYTWSRNALQDAHCRDLSVTLFVYMSHLVLALTTTITRAGSGSSVSLLPWPSSERLVRKSSHAM